MGGEGRQSKNPINDKKFLEFIGIENEKSDVFPNPKDFNPRVHSKIMECHPQLHMEK
ncbi:MAG: hypothetical protein CM1200mP11_3060 [Nitrosopumilaceae archaeon]|nr:MAG: hypothetical protein CM1200mP11_3060 [Nitrosopumilaceae archaeon]